LAPGLPAEPGGGLKGNASARAPQLRNGCPAARKPWGSPPTVLRSRRRLGRYQVYRGRRLSPPSLLPATRRPPRGQRGKGMRAIARGRARRPLARRAPRPGCQSRRLLAPSLRVATTRRAPGAAARLFTRAHPSTTGRTPLRAGS
jgi:hypothetical protein